MPPSLFFALRRHFDLLNYNLKEQLEVFCLRVVSINLTFP